MSTSKVKFMCSFGGKILARPSDGVLKYVGGETRIIAVSPDISFSELTKKVREITEKECVLKYQIIPEDLDALVSVKSDEDVKHMIEEYNRHETPKLRTFLFPANPLFIDNSMEPPPSIEQRYIEAINGILRTKTLPLRPIAPPRPSFTLSTCSSPKSESSPDGYSHDHPDMAFHNNYQLSRLYPLHKVQSSPNISHHHNAYSQPPNYFTCRLRPPLDFPRPTCWEPSGPGHSRKHNSGGGNSCNEERRFWGRASSVPQSPRNHGLRL
ncbi:hypothetical protein AALP_AA8G273000 [Arabis alpina]|uniref:PB1 domain-containing protein n=1 Tax=Arabis alpina TaxID=50452 RepID=A0A087G9S2_ARAAL|nr:hypothetical protein AALP_AA8G273000 [Arabis alpina]